MTKAAAQAILAAPSRPYVRPSGRPESTWTYDPTQNTRPGWVDSIPVPSLGHRADYL